MLRKFKKIPVPKNRVEILGKELALLEKEATDFNIATEKMFQATKQYNTEARKKIAQKAIEYSIKILRKKIELQEALLEKTKSNQTKIKIAQEIKIEKGFLEKMQ